MKADIIGDIHGCFEEFSQLTKKIGYSWESGIPLHPGGRILSFVGDITDRGPHSLKVIETVAELVQQNKGIYSPGNHCDKLYRYFKGNNVQVTHGLETTAAEYEALPSSERKRIKEKFMTLVNQAPLYQVLDEGKLIVAHAGIKESDIGLESKKVKDFVLYGDITGEMMDDGRPVRRDWAKHYKGKAWIVYGHTPVKDPRIIHHTINIDTGAVFGGKLTALRYPEMETVSVPSSMPFDTSRFSEFE